MLIHKVTKDAGFELLRQGRAALQLDEIEIYAANGENVAVLGS